MAFRRLPPSFQRAYLKWVYVEEILRSRRNVQVQPEVRFPSCQWSNPSPPPNEKGGEGDMAFRRPPPKLSKGTPWMDIGEKILILVKYFIVVTLVYYLRKWVYLMNMFKIIGYFMKLDIW